MKKTFEEYLRDDVWQAEGILDDDMPDAFDSWLSELDVEQWLSFGQNYSDKK